jgi:hypothetical protein
MVWAKVGVLRGQFVDAAEVAASMSARRVEGSS